MTNDEFVFLSWVMVGIAFVVISVAAKNDRSLLLKPSFIASVLFFLQVQVGSAIVSSEVAELLSNPWEFFTVIHGFSIVALLSSLLFFRARYRALFMGMSRFPFRKRLVLNRVYFLIVPTFLICAWYLTTVPVSQTGLFIILTRPDLADIMRESSYATLANPVLKYGYNLMSFAFAPIIAILSGLMLANRANAAVRLNESIFAAAMIVTMMLLVTLYGARGPSSMLLLSVLYGVFLSKGAPLDPLRLLLSVFIILLAPSMIVLFKSVDNFSFASFLESFLNIVERVFVRGVKPNIWYFDYIQSHGFFGIAGVPKIAVLVGETPLNVANHLALLYDRHSLLAGSANSSFVTQYYSFFGVFGVIMALGGLLLLDSICLLIRKWHPMDKLVASAALIVPFSALSFSQITTVFLSKGILFILIVVFVLRHVAGTGRERHVEKSLPKLYLKPAE